MSNDTLATTAEPDAVEPSAYGPGALFTDGVDMDTLAKYPSGPTDDDAAQMARLFAMAPATPQSPAITARQRLGLDPMPEASVPPAQE